MVLYVLENLPDLILYAASSMRSCWLPIHNRLRDMGLEELNQRSVQQCVADRADPNDEPQISMGHEAEYHTDHNHRNITHDAGILEGDLTTGHIFDDHRYTVIRSDPHLRHHIKRHAHPRENAADDQGQDPKRQRHLYFQDVLKQPAYEVCQITDTDHIDDSARPDALPCFKKHNHQYRRIHDQLPCTEGHVQKSADPQVHTGKCIYAEGTEPVGADADPDKKDAGHHHDAAFKKRFVLCIHWNNPLQIILEKSGTADRSMVCYSGSADFRII